MCATDIITQEYPDLFTGLGKLPVVYHLEIDPEATPVINAARRIPKAIRAIKLKKRLEEEEVMEKVQGHTPWVRNMVIILKLHKVRLCWTQWILIKPSNESIIHCQQLRKSNPGWQVWQYLALLTHIADFIKFYLMKTWEVVQRQHHLVDTCLCS